MIMKAKSVTSDNIAQGEMQKYLLQLITKSNTLPIVETVLYPFILSINNWEIKIHKEITES